MIDQQRHGELAITVCTPAELDALALHAAGLSQWQIALHLGISRRSVRDRLDNAHRKILNAQETE